MNRYFRVNSSHLSSIKRYTSNLRSYQQPSPKQMAALATALGVEDPHYHRAHTYETRSYSASDILEMARSFMIEGTRYDTGSDAGAGWQAIYTGQDKSPRARLGIHVDDLTDYQREYVEAAARKAGIDLYAES